VSRFATLAWLALRELWISFRLLALIGAFLLAALPVALVPYVAPDLAGAPLARLAWFATALAAALALAAGIAAATLSAELRRGTFAWLAVRAVPRTTLLLAWFLAFGAVLAVGMALAAIVTGISLGVAIAAEGIGAFVAASLAVTAVGLAAMAIGLLVGTMLRPVPAALWTIVAVGGALLAAAHGPLGWAPLPTASIAVLAGVGDAARPISDALSSSGTALAVAAAVLVLAAARLERADL
jgi:ABC-type transport system involved in multi-copper enzyme maturation permease subunit